jgi:hypothetical protein
MDQFYHTGVKSQQAHPLAALLVNLLHLLNHQTFL